MCCIFISCDKFYTETEDLGGTATFFLIEACIEYFFTS